MVFGAGLRDVNDLILARGQRAERNDESEHCRDAPQMLLHVDPLIVVESAVILYRRSDGRQLLSSPFVAFCPRGTFGLLSRSAFL